MNSLYDSLSRLEAKAATLGLAHIAEAPAADDEMSGVLPPDLNGEEVVSLWRLHRSAKLMYEPTYGQWGLQLLTPAAASERTELERSIRPDELGSYDFVLGEFIGDLDVLVVTNGGILVAPPIYPRSDWYRVGSSLAEFLDMFAAAEGQKFWE